jgi:hypothetical protein
LDARYNADKQRRYRARLNALKMMMRDREAARGAAAAPLTTTDAAALAAMTMAFLQIFSSSADLLARRLQAHLAADRGLGSASRTG